MEELRSFEVGSLDLLASGKQVRFCEWLGVMKKRREEEGEGKSVFLYVIRTVID